MGNSQLWGQQHLQEGALMRDGWKTTPFAPGKTRAVASPVGNGPACAATRGQHSWLESCKLMCSCQFLGTGMQSCTDSWGTAWQSGVPDSGPRTGTGLWPVRNWTTQQEASGGRLSKASSVFTAAPCRSHYCLSSASYQISGSTGFSKEHKPDCKLHT